MAQPTKYVPIYFAPDLDPAWSINPGTLTSVSNLVPTRRGTLTNYSVAYTSLTATINEATFGSPVMAAALKRINGTGRLFIATNKRLLEATSTAGVVDRSKGASDYSSATDFRYNLDWDCTSFGNDAIFVNKKNPPQVASASATAFADLGGGPPKAACCTTQKNFVLLGNCNDGTNDLGDQIWWSALGNDQSYTADAATQAGNYRLLDTPGNVTALVNMRDTVIAYKDDSIYVGDYQGSPLLWTWRLVTDKAGCGSVHGVVVVDGIHYFLHPTGMFRFDGASVQPIGRGVASKFIAQKIQSRAQFATVSGVYDELNGVILWYFSSEVDAFDTNFTKSCAIAYHPASDRFGYVLNTWPASAGSGYTPIKATFADLYAWAAFTPPSNILVIGSSSNTSALRGVQFGGTTSSTISLTTGDIGDEIQVTQLTQIKPRFLSYSGSLSDATVYGRPYENAANDAGTTFTADATKARWQGLKSARWHIATLPITSSGEIAGLYLTYVPAGTE